MQNQVINIEFPANLRYSSLVRHIAEEILTTAGFHSVWCSRLKLVVDELYMNAVKYGSTEDISKVKLCFEFDGQRFRFTIEDDGTGPKTTDPEELKQLIITNTVNDDLVRTSGRGLSMITRNWTDEMEVESSDMGGIRILFVKELAKATAPSAEETTQEPPAELVKMIMDADAQMKEVENALVSAPVSAPVSSPAGERITEASSQAGISGPTGEGQLIEFALSGEIDLSNIDLVANKIKDKIEKLGEGGILVLDFKGVSYINSTFIGNLASWHTHLSHKGAKLRIKNLLPSVREILQLVGLLDLIEVV